MIRTLKLILLGIVCSLFTGCMTPTTVAVSSDPVTASLHTSYEIVWFGEWPYWYTGHTYIPYYHSRPAPKHVHHVYKKYKPTLHKGRYHPSYQYRPNKVVAPPRKPVGRPSVGKPTGRPPKYDARRKPQRRQQAPQQRRSTRQKHQDSRR